MTTETETIVTPEAAPVTNKKMIPEDDVAKMIQERTAREREQTRLKHEENERLKKQLQDLQARMEKGNATPEDMGKLQAAKDAATEGMQQGMTQQQLEQLVESRMQIETLSKKLEDARQKDPEFAKLLETNAQNLYAEEVAGTAYLDNAPAVIKYLLKDKKSLALYRRALETDRSGVQAMLVLNNLSDLVADKAERPKSSEYEPTPELSDTSNTDQSFDVSKYISSKY